MSNERYRKQHFPVEESEPDSTSGERIGKQSLTQSEMSAIRAYSLDGYRQINRALRSGERLDEAGTLSVNRLEAAIGKLGKYSGVCYRGGVIDHRRYGLYSESLLSGKVVTERAFLSASMDINIAYNFLGNALYEIISVNGRIVNGFGVFGDEREIIFPPGTKFRVEDISETDIDGKIRFTRVLLSEEE